MPTNDEPRARPSSDPGASLARVSRDRLVRVSRDAAIALSGALLISATGAFAQQTATPAQPQSGVVAPGAGNPAAPAISAQQEQHLTHAQLMRLRSMHRAPPGDTSARQQNKELDQIGDKLLKETPKGAPGSSLSTGGGAIP